MIGLLKERIDPRYVFVVNFVLGFMGGENDIKILVAGGPVGDEGDWVMSEIVPDPSEVVESFDQDNQESDHKYPRGRSKATPNARSFTRRQLPPYRQLLIKKHKELKEHIFRRAEILPLPVAPTTPIS